MIEILDIFGIIFILLFVGISLIISYYIYVMYSHDKEKEFPLRKMIIKIIVLGMSLIATLIIIIPIDYLSSGQKKNILGLNFNMERIWEYMFIFIISFFFLNYFFCKFYRSQKEGMGRFIESIKKPLTYFLIYSTIAVIFFYSHSLKKQMKVLSAPISCFSNSDDSQIVIPEANFYIVTLKAKGSIILALIAPFILCASICFSIFGGASFAFYPIELINRYIYRPLEPNAEDIVYAKNALLKTSEDLIKSGKNVYDEIRKTEINQIQNKSDFKMTEKVLKKKIIELKRKSFEYKQIYDYFSKQDNLIEQNPIYYLSDFLLGIFLGLLSILIAIHSILNISNVNVILNGFFHFLNKINMMVSFLFFFILSLYLIISIEFSIFKISLMFSNFIQFHRFKINETWTDTFLINNNIIMFSFIGFIIFIILSCSEFFSYTNSEFFFNNLISKISILKMYYDMKLPQIFFLLFFFMSIFISFFMKEGRVLLKDKVSEFKEHLENEKNILMNDKNV